MSDFDYTDLTETGNIPLGQPWERAAIKDLSDVLHYLTHGLFFNPTDYADRLRQAAEAIEFRLSEPERFPLFHPEPKPDRAAIVVGLHVAALKLAADQLGVEVSSLLRYGKAKLENMTPAELDALCKEALQNDV